MTSKKMSSAHRKYMYPLFHFYVQNKRSVPCTLLSYLVVKSSTLHLIIIAFL